MSNRNSYGAPFPMEEIVTPSFPDNIVSIQQFAVEGTQPNRDKSIIQRAVNACIAQGGGKVVIPQGEWRSGPIHLGSNILLWLEEGATISFSPVYEDYLPVVFTRWEGMECYNYSPLIYANGCENVGVAGAGKLVGNGEAWWHWKKLQQEAANSLCYAESEGIAVEQRVYGTEQAALRPSFIQPIHCRNVLIEGITVVNGPQWMIHPVYSENVIVRGVSIISNGHNRDGLNPDSCKNVVIEDCSFATGDDCIAINSGMNEDGWRVNKPCENIIIRNCTMKEGHGGLVIGSGMSGGVRNVYAYNCNIIGGDKGIRLKSMRGRGGYVENIWFENIEINDVREEAIQINMYYEFSTVVPKTVVPSDFNHIYFSNIKGEGAQTAIMIKGLPEQKLDHIHLENIQLSAKVAFVCSDVATISMGNVQINTQN